MTHDERLQYIKNKAKQINLRKPLGHPLTYADLIERVEDHYLYDLKKIEKDYSTIDDFLDHINEVYIYVAIGIVNLV